MPVVLRPEDYEAWLDTDMRQPELLTPLLGPYTHEEMSAYRGQRARQQPFK
jgi:putative SOS response-associated peptidase YedK